MAYELGAGLGIALFGLILTRSYSATIVLPSGLNETHGAAGVVIDRRGGQPDPGRYPPGWRKPADGGGEAAFTQAHSLVLQRLRCGSILLLLAARIWRNLTTVTKPQTAL